MNFHLHQRRSIELAYYLEQVYGDRKNDLRIGICGGGMGGLTCFVALHGLGFRETYLHEAGRDLMGLQKDCHHRHGHPSYNDWPMRGTFSSTTDLPFMNWTPGTANAIARQIDDDDLIKRLIEEKSAYIRRNVYIQEIARTAGDSQWSLVVSDMVLDGDGGMDGGESSLGTDDFEFDVIVFAFGFGNEKDLPHSRVDSYWWDDNFENYRREHFRFTDHDKIIGGSGDGGLIDAARIGFGKAPGDALACRLIAAARDDRFRQPPFNPERPVPATRDKKSAFEGKLEGLFELTDSGDSLIRAFQSLIGSVLKEDDSDLALMLRTLINDRNRYGERCEVVSRTAFKVKPNLSPVNVMLFMLLTVRGPGARNIATFAEKKITVTEEGIISLADDERTGPEGILLFLRQGPDIDAELWRFVKPLAQDGEGTRVREDRTDGYDFGSVTFELDSTLRPDFLHRMSLVPAIDQDAESALLPGVSDEITWDYRMRSIERFIAELGLQSMVPLLKRDGHGFYVELTGPMAVGTDDEDEDTTARKNRDAILNIGGFDRQLFGAPVTYRPVPSGHPSLRASAIWKLDEMHTNDDG